MFDGMLTVCLLSNRASLDQDDASWSGSVVAEDGEIVYATGPVGSCTEAQLLVCGHIDWRADPNTYLDRLEAVAAERDAALAQAAELTEQRDHWRELVEKVGLVRALEGLVAAAEPICGGKPEVRPGRARLPEEWYPYEAASRSVRVLREALIEARAALAGAGEPREEAVASLPCGHPETAVVTGGEGTSYCGACEAEGRAG